MHRLFVFRIHTEEIVGCAVEFLFAVVAVVLVELAVTAFFTVETLFAEGTALAVFVETGAEGLLEAAFAIIAVEVLTEGAAFAAFFAFALEAGTEGLSEGAFAVFTLETLGKRLAELAAFALAVFFVELAETGTERLAERTFTFFALEAGLTERALFSVFL